MTKRTLKILQLAAYQSNIGDNANISGMRASFADYFSDYELSFSDWDIVNFSWSMTDFSDDTIDFINSFDLFIIGGGGFLEIIPGADTWTGTRVNIPKEIFERIRVPLVFFAVGIDTVRADLDGRPVEREIEKFNDFVEFISGLDRALLSTRHDGSLDVIERLIGKSGADKFMLVPDGGFYATKTDMCHPEIAADKINIAINFGGDLVDARYQADYSASPVSNNPLNLTRPKDYEAPSYLDHRGYSKFLISFANVIRSLSFDLKNVNFILTPHIYRDLEPHFHLLSVTGFPYCRREMTCAAYVHGFSGKDYVMDLYSKCDLTIGMRFHANVCPIGLGTPSIGLGTFPMIGNLYRSLELNDRFIQASAGSKFEDDLYRSVISSLDNSDKIRQRYREVQGSLQTMTSDLMRKIDVLLDRED